jgi:hypothetical protein
MSDIEAQSNNSGNCGGGSVRWRSEGELTNALGPILEEAGLTAGPTTCRMPFNQPEGSTGRPAGARANVTPAGALFEAAKSVAFVDAADHIRLGSQLYTINKSSFGMVEDLSVIDEDGEAAVLVRLDGGPFLKLKWQALGTPGMWFVWQEQPKFSTMENFRRGCDGGTPQA